MFRNASNIVTELYRGNVVSEDDLYAHGAGLFMSGPIIKMVLDPYKGSLRMKWAYSSKLYGDNSDVPLASPMELVSTFSEFKRKNKMAWQTDSKANVNYITPDEEQQRLLPPMVNAHWDGTTTPCGEGEDDEVMCDTIAYMELPADRLDPRMCSFSLLEAANDGNNILAGNAVCMLIIVVVTSEVFQIIDIFDWCFRL